MSNLFMVLLLISIIALAIGMVNPDLVLKFLDKEKRNRKHVLLVFGIVAFASFILVGITAPNIEEELVVEKEVEDLKEEKEDFVLSVDEKELLIQRYGDLDNPEKMKIDSIIKNIDEYDEVDKKIISENKERIEEEKVTLEKEKESKEKTKVEAKEKAEKENMEYGLDEWWEVEDQFIIFFP